MGQYGLAAANAQTSANENSRRLAYDREQAALQGMLSLRGQQSTSQNEAANRAFQGNESALQRAYGEAQSRAQTTAQFNDNKQKYEQQLALQQNSQQFTGSQNALSRAASAARGGALTNANGTTNVAGVTNAAIQAINNDYSNASDAVSALAQREDQIVASIGQAGYDRLVQYANDSLPAWDYQGRH